MRARPKIPKIEIPKGIISLPSIQIVNGQVVLGNRNQKVKNKKENHETSQSEISATSSTKAK